MGRRRQQQRQLPGHFASKEQRLGIGRGRAGPQGASAYKMEASRMFGADRNDATPVSKAHGLDNVNCSVFLIDVFKIPFLDH